jgi:hypothetical protein
LLFPALACALGLPADLGVGAGEAHRFAQSLALFDDPDRGGEVFAKISNRYGPSLGRAFVAAKDGPHREYPGALPSLVQDVARLTEKLRA